MSGYIVESCIERNISEQISGKYQDDLAIPNLVAYITRADKAKSGMIGGVGIDPNHIADSMVRVSNAFHKNSRIRLHHFIVSFTRWECTDPGVLYCIGMEISRRIGQEYQITFALHEDTDYPHSTSIYGGMRWCPCYGSSEGPEASEYLETQEWIRFAWWLPLDVNRGDCRIRGRYRSMAAIWLG